jgi:hypothetical protein
MRTTKSNHLFVLPLLAVAAFLPLHAGKKTQAPPAVIAGTVFRDPGLALPGATVVLMRKDGPKSKKLDQIESNYRGEFRFEVPATAAVYIVRATLKGYRPEQKEITISGEERIEATLVLVPESKK